MGGRPHDAEEPHGTSPEPGDDRGADGPVPTGAGAGDGKADGPEGTAGPHESSDTDIEARWAEIVAQLGDLGAAPRDADAQAPPERPHRRSTDAPPDVPADAPEADRRPPDPSTPRSWSPDPDVEAAEEHFQPPDPGPVLGGDPLLTMAWGAVAGVPLLMLVAVVAWQDLPALVLQVAGAAFVAAVGLLLWRMPHRRDDDDGPGAVV
ncbi:MULTISPECIES: hypothetical protein [unclassified Actinotalea]|uniref:hypothetical protein n=1 Tax=unclassified Actinotalea TaxID=2638618 RepID=UPI0015F3A903|nr:MULTISPECIES: hypothetical protein [unclassified Actinotalea]